MDDKSRSGFLRWRALALWLASVGFLLFAAARPEIHDMIHDLFEPPTWQTIEKRMARDWPNVPQISTEALARELERPEAERPILIDVRTAKEFAASHIHGAIRAETPTQIRKLLKTVPSDRAVVFYCAIGLRSAAATARVASEGRAHVKNLTGSLFMWANEGRPLESNGQPAFTVIPYGKRWQGLLDPRFLPVKK